MGVWDGGVDRWTMDGWHIRTRHIRSGWQGVAGQRRDGHKVHDAVHDFPLFPLPSLCVLCVCVGGYLSD
jgi:hypothetical protein